MWRNPSAHHVARELCRAAEEDPDDDMSDEWREMALGPPGTLRGDWLLQPPTLDSDWLPGGEPRRFWSDPPKRYPVEEFLDVDRALPSVGRGAKDARWRAAKRRVMQQWAACGAKGAPQGGVPVAETLAALKIQSAWRAKAARG
eukprot:gene28540-48977_t